MLPKLSGFWLEAHGPESGRVELGGWRGLGGLPISPAGFTLASKNNQASFNSRPILTLSNLRPGTSIPSLRMHKYISRSLSLFQFL